MKQTFEIVTKDGLNAMELLGCLEDTLGRGKVISIELVSD